MSGRKQILSISGGGVRGLYSIAILAEIEQNLADEQRDQNLNIGIKLYRDTQHNSTIIRFLLGFR